MALALAAATLALGLSACGSGGDATTGSASNPQPFTLDLDWYVNPDHAGVYSALDRGFFRQVGLDVQPQVPSDPSAPIKEVAAGRADLAVSYEPEVLLARNQGLEVEAVAAIVNRPLTSLISLPKGGIASAADLQGKTMGTAGIPYQSDYLKTILGTAGLSSSSAKEVNVGLNLLPALIGGEVDAILGGYRNIEGVDLQQRGLNPRIVPVDQLGVPTYDELVLVARSSTVNQHPEAIRASSPRWRGGLRTRSHTRRRLPTPCSRPARAWIPMQTRAEVERDAAAAGRGPRAAVRLPGSGAVARIRGVDGRARPDLARSLDGHLTESRSPTSVAPRRANARTGVPRT